MDTELARNEDINKSVEHSGCCCDDDDDKLIMLVSDSEPSPPPLEVIQEHSPLTNIKNTNDVAENIVAVSMVHHKQNMTIDANNLISSSPSSYNENSYDSSSSSSTNSSVGLGTTTVIPSYYNNNTTSSINIQSSDTQQHNVKNIHNNNNNKDPISQPLLANMRLQLEGLEQHIHEDTVEQMMQTLKRLQFENESLKQERYQSQKQLDQLVSDCSQIMVDLLEREKEVVDEEIIAVAYKNALQNTAVPVFIVQSFGKLIYANKPFEDLLGISKHSLRDSPDWLTLFRDEEALREGQRNIFEFFASDKDHAAFTVGSRNAKGEPIDPLLLSCKIRDSHGKHVLTVVHMLPDVIHFEESLNSNNNFNNGSSSNNTSTSSDSNHYNSNDGGNNR